MSTSILVSLRPWTVPNFASIEMPPRPRQDGPHEAPSLPLAEIPAVALSDLCDDFRREVFRKAGKRDPNPPHERAVAAPSPRSGAEEVGGG